MNRTFELNEKIIFSNKKNDVLSIGELLIDMISTEYGDNHTNDTYQRFFGGSPANIAMNLKKLGCNSLLASCLGEDSFGNYLIHHLKNRQIDTSYVQRVDESTSMVVVTKSKGTPIPIFYREADYHLSYTKQLEEALLDSKIVHFSCWGISREPVRQTIERVIDEARKNDILVCFDPNYHPMIWQKGEDGVEYVKSIIKKVDFIKPSEDDAERLFGKDTLENQVKKFLDLGAKLVMMTLGKDGAIVSDGKETLKFDTLATEVVDATGAGDAFWSGFYASVVKGCSIKEAISFGSAVSAYKLKHLGAVVDLPKLEVIKEMYRLQEDKI